VAVLELDLSDKKPFVEIFRMFALDPLSSLTSTFDNIYSYLETIKTHLSTADFEELFKSFALYEKYDMAVKDKGGAFKPIDI